jgi:uncharacterized protein (DUF305 family)
MRAWVVALLAVLALAGCGSGDGAAGGNGTDAAFVVDMSAHHLGAIEMARIAQDRATRPEIRALAQDIIGSQESEIARMKSIAKELPEPPEGGMGIDHAEMGMGMDTRLLEYVRPFDRVFIDMMIPHHEGALVMAKRVIADGEQPALRRMARAMIAAQAREIAQMRRWRKAWYGVDEIGEPDGSHSHH